MNSRGEKDFIKLPRFAAKLYDYMTQGYNTQLQIEEIACYLASKINVGRLLDIGTGPGRLLYVINNINPEIELYGLDISISMVEQAKKNLKDNNVNLKVGNIEKTEYKDDFFDIITTTGSFYLWDNPEDSINEIYRILKVNKSAYLFETYKNYNEYDYKKALKANLKNENILRKSFSPYFLNKQLQMTYKISEIKDILDKTRFNSNYHISKIELSGLPTWLKIDLNKTINTD